MNKCRLLDLLKPDSLTGGLIFITAFLIFWFSPIHQLTDSNYSMLLSQSLLEHRSFALDQYAIPRRQPVYHDNTYKNGEMYQIELVGPHLYYYLPPGSSVLSVPYVALMNTCGINAANEDGSYNADGETVIETSLAALLMAALACIFFLTARQLLPRGWSALIALAGALGTQVWSTASRALWSDTWAIFLLGMVVLILLRQEIRGRAASPVLLASLLAWMYFVRPTNSVSILAVTIYLLLFHRPLWPRYTATGALWLAGFIAYSWSNFGQLLPNYFAANRLSFQSFWTAFAGNLLSPSRGLLVYVPVLIFVAYLLVRHWSYLKSHRLAWMALAVILVHLIIIAGFTPWNGGFCYGPRYTTGLVPWFVLLAILGIHAGLAWRERERAGGRASAAAAVWRATMAAGGALLLLSVFINARGATSYETWIWNIWPTNVDRVPGKIWDWREPQFLAGLIHPPLPDEFPVMEGQVSFATTEADKYLWYGWSWSEPQIRWSDGREAAVIFALRETGGALLRMKLGPFLVRGKLDEQRVELRLNGRALQTLVLKEGAAQVYSIELPGDALRSRNILTFGLKDAASPKALKTGADERRLGVRVEWMEVEQRASP